MNPAEPVDVWRVMSPTSYQAAPPRALDTTRLASILQILRCPLSVQFDGRGIIRLDLREIQSLCEGISPTSNQRDQPRRLATTRLPLSRNGYGPLLAEQKAGVRVLPLEIIRTWIASFSKFGFRVRAHIGPSQPRFLQCQSLPPILRTSNFVFCDGNSRELSLRLQPIAQN